MDVYEALRELLDKHPAGCPPAPEIIEILSILFTPEEAKLALGLGYRPLSAAAVAARAGAKVEIATGLLESMANKGLIFAKKKDGVYQYALLPTMPGIFEFPFMKGEKTPTIKRLAELWKVYMQKLSQGFGSPSSSFSRIVPIQEEVESKPGVLPYDKVYEMIDRAQVVGLGRCACRESNEKCDAPREACMMFDDACVFLVERGYGRYISKDEMEAKLREFDKLGLMHQINNSQDRLSFICNCCSCCCELLRTLREVKNPHVLSPSAFIPQLDADSCSGCGICADERCPMQAITMVDNLPQIKSERCLGCGLCVTGCPASALSLVRRTDAPVPQPTIKDMNFTTLKEKGKLEAFLPYVNLEKKG